MWTNYWLVFLFMIGFLGIFLSFLLLTLQMVLSGVIYLNSSPFECGFNNKGSISVNYSVYFFMLLMVFVLFDLEIVLLLAFLYNSLYNLFLFIFMLFFIFFTYYLEVFFNKIIWATYCFYFLSW